MDVEPELTLRGLAQIIEPGNGGRHGDCFDEGAALLGSLSHHRPDQLVRYSNVERPNRDARTTRRTADVAQLRRTGQFLLMADQSEVRCPVCGHRERFSMPENACVVVLDCPACGERLRPKPGDCCVFCSYGSTPCPPTQTEGKRRSSRAPTRPNEGC